MVFHAIQQSGDEVSCKLPSVIVAFVCSLIKSFQFTYTKMCQLTSSAILVVHWENIQLVKRECAVCMTFKPRTYRLLNSGVQITFSLCFAVKFELQSFGPSIVRIRNIETGNFLAIDSKGVLQTKVS